MREVEILAPVGKMSMLYAGLSAGACSFYLALDDFGARAYAKNFSLENIEEVIDYVHLFDKKVFITINTLIKDEEIDKAIFYIEKLFEYGADAILIQDIGLYSLVKDINENARHKLEFHASTQMAIKDYEGALAAKKLGFDRVVVARESEISEIEKICKLDIDTEVFVHGSLCVSFSGECLMSSYLGKRSANRGRCAGICRKKYQLINDGKVLGEDYYLSMKDLSTIDFTDDLIKAGVDSLKIEGRMKTDEYVYNTVKNYRQKLEKNTYDKDQLRDISNRSYTNGFVFGQKFSYLALENENKHREIGEVYEKNGKRFFKSNSNLIKESILQVTTEKNKKLPLTLIEDLKKNQELELKDFKDAKIGLKIYLLSSKILKENLDQGLNSYKNLPLDIKFEAQIGQKPKITLKYKDTKISYEGENLVEEGKNISLTKKDISENLTKLGNTIYKANEVEINIAPNIFLRKKDINSMRRKAIESLNEKRLSIYKNKPVKIEKRKLKDKKNYKREKNIELLSNDIDISLLKDFDNIYLRKYDKKFDGLNIFYIMDADKKYDLDFISFLKEKNFKGVVFNNYKDFVLKDELLKNGFEIRIGRYLNVFNSYTFDFYNDFSSMISSSVENSFENINKNSRIYPTEILAYGPIELMNMRHCPFSAIKKCGLKGCESCKFSDSKIKDEDGNLFDIKRRDGLSRIYSNESANIDLKKIEKSVSLLYLVRDDEDLKNIRKNKINNLGYDRGVI
ncbi:MAG: U32 family peptidase [Anaerococcus vaginalis]|uniref:peptidase U32 family protein n=1 Tax=Anaerococcus vaginalis TaxID=33037 RepID=UPI0029009C8E|nr:U32 family peptidase [Anaerococcus vaginalis]MDU1707079.1 U32 family peptidase [Anaerococcus vaginalis]MDU1763157.1 U32 family peptidase [Anaerococcus vaginalis]